MYALCIVSWLVRCKKYNIILNAPFLEIDEVSL